MSSFKLIFAGEPVAGFICIGAVNWTNHSTDAEGIVRHSPFNTAVIKNVSRQADWFRTRLQNYEDIDTQYQLKIIQLINLLF